MGVVKNRAHIFGRGRGLGPQDKKKRPTLYRALKLVAEGLGFEPRLTGPEPAVLPLDDPSTTPIDRGKPEPLSRGNWLHGRLKAGVNAYESRQSAFPKCGCPDLRPRPLKMKILKPSWKTCLTDIYRFDIYHTEAMEKERIIYVDIQTIILGFLMSQSMTGYEIKQRFGASFSFFSGLSYGSIYPAIGKLEKEGMVTTEIADSGGLPKKRVCTITECGRKAFLEALTEPLPVNRYKNAFISRLFFFAFLPAEKRLEMVRSYLLSVDDTRKKLDSFEPLIKGAADPFQWLCFQSGQRFLEDLSNNIEMIEKELLRLKVQPAL